MIRSNARSRYIPMLATMVMLGCRSPVRDDPTPTPEPESSAPVETAPVLLWMGARSDDALAQSNVSTPIVLTRPGGEELFLGRVDDPGRDGQARVGAFHSRDAMPAWLSSRLDVPTEKPKGILMMLEAGVLVVTTANRRVLFLDPATGKTNATQYLETNALRICRVKPGLLRIDEADGSVDIDMSSLTSRPTKSSCGDAAAADARRAAQTTKGADDAPLPRGYEEMHSLDVNGVRLALGRLGTETKLMRIDPTPRSRDTLWVVTVRPEELNEIAGHPFFWSDGNDVLVEAQSAVRGDERGEVRGTGDYFLTAFDARTGRELWRASPGKPAGAAFGWVVTPTHVYVARGIQLDVFDRSGTFVGWVGWR